MTRSVRCTYHVGMDVIAEIGLTAVARMCDCKPPSVSEWRRNGIPEQRCIQIEWGTQGRFTCEVIRPDVRWIRLADPDWPHPNGRPCVDLASTVREAA